ncbi:MAG: hypothetical protein ACON4U_02220 [Myxococcota bacterium]
MALEKEEIDNLKADLKKVYSKAQGQFLYCPAGKNGDPILVLSAKKITMTQVKEVREKAKVKTFVRGRIALEAGQSGKELVFYTKTDPPGKLVKHVKQFFGRSVTKLKKAVFKKVEEAVAISANAEDASEFAEEGDVTAIQDENVSLSEFDNKNAVEIKDALLTLDSDTRSLERNRQKLLEQAEELQYQIMVKGTKAFRSKEELAKAEKKAAELRRQADEIGQSIANNKAKSDEAHAQYQNRIADEQEAEYERMLGEVDSEVDPSIVEQYLTAEAKKEEEVALQKKTIEDIESRLELLQEQERSQFLKLEQRRNKINKKVEETGDIERGERLLQKIEEERQTLLGNLQTHHLEVDKLQAEYLLSHAMSDRLMDKMDSRVRDHWTRLNNSENQEEYNNLVQGLMDIEKPYHEARERVRTLDHEVSMDRENINIQTRNKESLNQTIDDLNLEITRSEGRKAKITAKLNSVQGDSIKVKRYSDRLEQENKHLSEYQNLRRERKEERTQVETSLQSLTNGLTQKESDLLQAKTTLNEKQSERNALMLSETERATVEMIAAREDGAKAKAVQAHEKLAAKQLELDERRAKVRDYKESEKKFREVNARLVALQFEYEQQKKMAAQYKFPWRNKKKINEARAELPALEAEMEALKKEFAQAKTEFDDKRANYNDADIENAFTAEQQILELEKKAADADAFALEIKEQRLQNEAQLAAMSHDIYEQRLENTKGLLINNIDGYKDRFERAEQELSEIEARFEVESTKLIESEIKLETLKAELNAPLSMVAFKAKLSELTNQEDIVKNQRNTVDQLQDDIQSSQQAIDNINKDLAEHATMIANANSEEGSIALHYLQSLDAVEQSASDESEILEEAVEVHDAHEQAEVDRSNAQRKAGLIDSTREVALSIKENRTLIDRFNKLTGDKDAKAYDLMVASDRKELKSKKPQAYQKLKEFTQSLEEKSLSMIAEGASLQELQNAFAEIPNGLRPPSFREEVARFHQVSQFLEEDESESSVLDQAHKLAKKKKTFEQTCESIKEKLIVLTNEFNDVNTEIAEGISAFAQNYDPTEVAALKEALKGKGADKKADNAADIQALDDFVGSATAIFGLGSAAIEAKQAYFDKKNNMAIMDPIEKKMAQDRLLSSLLGLGEETVNTIKQFSTMDSTKGTMPPGMGVLGVVLKSEELVKAVLQASARRILAAKDSMLQEAAKLAGSPMASALEETKVQERQLYIKYGIKAATTAAGITADIMATFPGPHQAVGAALNVVTWLAEKTVELKLYMVKKEQVREARDLLRRAQKGDAEAKTLLFQKHAVYAKGLIAAMALEKDSFAMAYVQSRGLDDSEIQASSFKIISKYLLSKAEQSAEDYDPEAESTKWRDRVVFFKKKMSQFAHIFGRTAFEIEHDSRIDELKTFYIEVNEMDEMHDKAVLLLPKIIKKKEETIAKGSNNQTYIKQEVEIRDFISNHQTLKNELRAKLVEWSNKVATFRSELDDKNDLETNEEAYKALSRRDKENHRISKIIVPTLEQFIQETVRAAV